MTRKPWTYQELKFLHDEGSNYSAQELGEKLGRPTKMARWKAAKEGIKLRDARKDSVGVPKSVWDEEKISYLRENAPNQTRQELADHLGVTVAQVSQSLSYYKIPGRGMSRKRTPEENEKIASALRGRRNTPKDRVFSSLLPEVSKLWVATAEKESDLTPDTASIYSQERAFWECSDGHTTVATFESKAKSMGVCKSCKTSKGEKAVNEFIQSLGIETVTSNRTIIKPLELDIYIPEKKIAVEFNGVFWHSERCVVKNYHAEKFERCREAGIRLIQIWEDDWRDKREVVEKMLRHKLGKSSSPVIPARKTEVVDLTPEEARSFLDENHIQGTASGSIKKGLTHEGVLVAVMVIRRRSSEEYELVRYATSCRVPGGHSKLLRHSAVPGTTVVTFADHEVSDGSLYEKTGWHKVDTIRPDYKYLQGDVRSHKFNFRLERFKNDPELQYVEGLAESELAELNKLWRTWDSGKTKYQIEM